MPCLPTRGIAGFLRTGRALRRRRCDVAVDLQGNWKSAALVRLSGAPTRLGIARRQRREPGSRVLVLAGNGHVAWPGGIPERVLRRSGEPGLVLGNVDGDPRALPDGVQAILWPGD